jgi:PEP-CTERM motif
MHENEQVRRWVMGRFRFFSLAVLCFLLMASTAVVRADGIPVDPVMGVRDPICVEGCPIVEGTTFSFFSNAFGGGINQFQNASGVDWTSLLIDVTTNLGTLPSVPADTITCLTNAFATCQSFDLANGDTAIYLTGMLIFPDDIPNGAVATFNLNDLVNGVQPNTVDGAGGWGLVREFDVTANAASPVPEPGTITLLGVGLAAFVAKRKLRRESNPSA